VTLEIAAGRIARIEPAEQRADLPVVAPGLVDLQINGYGGVEFNDPKLTPDKVRQVALSQDRFGVTAMLATCTTDSREVLQHALTVIARAIRELPEVAARIPGIHLEGPYISPEDGPRGAHPKQHVRPPDWDEFRQLQDAAEGRIRLVTVSPEYDSAAAFIRRADESGVLVAIGHTKATSDQIRAAADAGARMSTHLGNGAHPLIRRHPNYIWDQLADDRLVASLIVDGHHLPPAVVKSMIRAKGIERVVLVSDITSMGGMPPGRYETGLGALEVLPTGKLVPAGQPDILAGASLPIDVCVANVMRYAGLDLAGAITMASLRPAQLIGLDHAGLEVGAAADLFVFKRPTSGDTSLRVHATYHGGRETTFV
jgi:N-acetylglucosamine-6-phosphate deacetylase